MFRKLAKKLAPFAWLLPGFLLWLAFPPYGEKIEAFFALAPLIWLTRNSPAGKSFRKWFLNGMVFWIGTLSWMPAIVKNGGPWPLVLLGWIALSAYCSLYFGAFGALSSLAWRWTDEPVSGIGFRSRGWARYVLRLTLILFVEPVLWAGLELVRARFLGGFAWNLLGTAPAMMGFAAPAAVGGIYLLSAMAVLVNGTVASIAERMMRPNAAGVGRGVRFLETVLPLALVLAIWKACAPYAAEPQNARPLSVGLVQRNFPCVFNAASEKGVHPLEPYRSLCGRFAHLTPDLIVCPESAFCEFGSLDGDAARTVAGVIASYGGAKAVLAGGSRTGPGGELYNSAALYSRNGTSIYDKAHLVPFGEYIPFDKTFTSLQALAPVGSCSPGELKLLDLDGMKIGAAICFEDTDSAQMRRLAAMGAQVLVFITNDSWFYGSVEPVQHQWQAAARAVETGLPVVRTGNSGVTGTVSPSGAALWLSEGGKPLTDARGAMYDTVMVPVSPVPTPYVRFGDTPLFVAFLAVLAAIAAAAMLPSSSVPPPGLRLEAGRVTRPA